jgi:hypothetical protein
MVGLSFGASLGGLNAAAPATPAFGKPSALGSAGGLGGFGSLSGTLGNTAAAAAPAAGAAAGAAGAAGGAGGANLPENIKNGVKAALASQPDNWKKFADIVRGFKSGTIATDAANALVKSILPAHAQLAADFAAWTASAKGPAAAAAPPASAAGPFGAAASAAPATGAAGGAGDANLPENIKNGVKAALASQPDNWKKFADIVRGFKSGTIAKDAANALVKSILPAHAQLAADFAAWTASAKGPAAAGAAGGGLLLAAAAAKPATAGFGQPSALGAAAKPALGAATGASTGGSSLFGASALSGAKPAAQLSLAAGSTAAGGAVGSGAASALGNTTGATLAPPPSPPLVLSGHAVSLTPY